MAVRFRVEGPLAAYADGYAAELARLGYTPGSAGHLMRLAAHLSRWLDGRQLTAEALTPKVAARFLAARRAGGWSSYVTPGAVDPLLRYLRALGVTEEPATAAGTAVEELLERYRRYLLVERGAAESSTRVLARAADRFLKTRVVDGELALDGLTAAGVCDHSDRVAVAVEVPPCRGDYPRPAGWCGSVGRFLAAGELAAWAAAATGEEASQRV